jgi:hypothetical protein
MKARSPDEADGAGGALCYTGSMSKTAKQLLERVASWPEEDIEKLEQAARQIEAWRNGEYHATDEELRALDEAIAEIDRGEVASEAQVKAAYAKFRNA